MSQELATGLGVGLFVFFAFVGWGIKTLLVAWARSIENRSVFRGDKKE